MRKYNFPYLFCFFLTFFLLILVALGEQPVYAENLSREEGLKVIVDEREVSFDTKPFIDSNNRTMVPIRFVSEELGFTVNWDDKAKQVAFKNGNKIIKLWIGSNRILINEKALTIDTVPIIKNGRTMVPVRFVAEGLGAIVEWDAQSRTVFVRKPGEVLPSSEMAVVTGSVVNVREGPGTNFKRVGQVVEGTIIQVLEAKDNWYYVELPGHQRGWVAGWLVSVKNGDNSLPDEDIIEAPQGRKVAVITADVVNIREDASANSTRLGQVYRGQYFDITGEKNGWYRIKYQKDREGWVAGWLVFTRLVADYVSRGSVDDSGKLLGSVKWGAGLVPGEDSGGKLKEVTGILVNKFNERLELGIAATQEITCKTLELQNPLRLVIDIPNSILGSHTKEGSLQINTQLAETVRIGQFTPDTVRLVMDLNKKADHKVDTGEDNRILNVKIYPSEENSLNGKTVVLDPGHASIQSGGWSDPGAVGPTGLREADVVMDIARRTAELLNRQGATVILTRTENTILTLKERAQVANDNDADIFVSIHANASPKAEACGTSTYYYAPPGLWQGEERRKLASIMQSELVNACKRKDLGIFEANFNVLVNTKMPSVLVETAFISNPQEEKLLANANFRSLLAQGIAAGVVEYFNKK